MENLVVNRLWSEDQAAAAREVFQTLYDQIWLPLQVPSADVWQNALQRAFIDAREAALSLGHFGFITFRPVVLLLYMALHYVSRIVWKYVIVQGISQQGVQYVTAAGRRVYQFQRSLTKEQVLMEVGFLIGLLSLYQLHKFLRRKAYFRRAQAWARRKWDGIRRSYKRSKDSLSMVSTSVVLLLCFCLSDMMRMMSTKISANCYFCGNSTA